MTPTVSYLHPPVVRSQHPGDVARVRTAETFLREAEAEGRVCHELASPVDALGSTYLHLGESYPGTNTTSNKRIAEYVPARDTTGRASRFRPRSSGESRQLRTSPLASWHRW